VDYITNPRQEHDQFTILRKLPDVPFPFGLKELLASSNKKVEIVQNEIALLNYLMGIVSIYNKIIITIIINNIIINKYYYYPNFNNLIIYKILAIIQKRDPDIIVGHNFIDFHLDILLHRMKSLGISNWSRIGRFRRTM